MRRTIYRDLRGLKPMASNENKHDRKQEIFDALTHDELANCEKLGDVEKLVDAIYDRELM